MVGARQNQTVDLGIPGLGGAQILGQGGFGTVYVAEDEDFGRRVAVKVLRTIDEDGRRRFERERRVMGRLDGHPNVVTPYRSGYNASGEPFLVMEYVDGGTLADELRRSGPLSWDLAVRYIVPIARALAFGHERGVLHRDVKPENILLTADGVPKLADFGIAAAVDHTATEAQAFSMAHAPPETFLGGAASRDERSDVYSLASTLFTLVAGRPPFAPDGTEADSQMAYIVRIADQPVPSLNLGARYDAIMANALAKDPGDRPGSARALAEVLESTVEGVVGDAPDAGPTALDTTVAVAHPTGAGSPGRPGPSVRPAADETAGRRGRRMILMAAVAGAIGLALTATALLVSGSFDDDATTEGPDSLDAAAGPDLASGDDADGSAAGGAPSDEAAAEAVPIEVYDDHDVRIESIALLDDGRLVSVDGEGLVVVRDPAAPNQTPVSFRAPAGLGHVTGLGGGYLAAATTIGEPGHMVFIWDLADPTIDPIELPFEFPIEGLVALPDGELLVESGGGFVWDPDLPEAGVKNAGFAFVGSVLAVYEDGRLVVDTPDGLVTSDVVGDRGEKLLYSYESAEFILTAADILPDGRLVTASLGGVVHLWDIGDPDVDPTGVEPVELSRRDEDSFQLAALADGRVAFSVGSGTIMVVDPENPAADPIGFPGHDLLVSGIVGLPDGRVASAGARTLQIWDPDRLPERIVPGGGPSGIDEPDVVFAGHPTGEPIWSLARLADGRVVSGSGDGTVRVWRPDGPTGEAVDAVEFDAHRDAAADDVAIAGIVALADGRIASGSAAGTIYVWNPDDPGGPREAIEATGPLSALIELDGRLIHTSGNDIHIRPLDDLSAEPVILTGHDDQVMDLLALPGNRVASGALDGTARIWDLDDPLADPVIHRHQDAVWHISHLSDGRVVSGGRASDIHVWDPSRPDAEPIVYEQSFGALSLAVLPDGRVASGTVGGTVNLWYPDDLDGPRDVYRGHRIAHPDDEVWVVSLLLLDDGRMASGGLNGEIQVWDPSGS